MIRLFELGVILVFYCASSLALAGTWQGTAGIQSAKWGNPGEQAPFTLEFSGSFMKVKIQRSTDAQPFFERLVDFSKNKIIEDSENDWLMVCVPQSSGLFEVHEWAPYGESEAYLNYRFVSDKEDCESGAAEIHAYWLVQ